MDLLKTPMCQAWLILLSDMVYLLVEMISNLDRQRWNLCLLTFWSVLVWRYAVLHFPWHFLCYFYSFIYSTLVYYFFQFATCLHALPGCTINLLCTIVYCLHFLRLVKDLLGDFSVIGILIYLNMNFAYLSSQPVSIVSYNHLGNNDGKNLSAPKQFRSKEVNVHSISCLVVWAQNELNGFRCDIPWSWRVPRRWSFLQSTLTEMLLSYIFVPSMVKYGILSNNRRC